MLKVRSCCGRGSAGRSRWGADGVLEGADDVGDVALSREDAISLMCGGLLSDTLPRNVRVLAHKGLRVDPERCCVELLSVKIALLRA